MSADAPGAWIFEEGALRPADGPALSPAGEGALYGPGFFETFRTSGGRVHGWPRHRARLARACAAAGLSPGPAALGLGDGGSLGAAVRALLGAHGWADAMMRLTLTAGDPGGPPRERLSARPLPPSDPEEGIGLRVLAVRRDAGEWLPRPKSLAYDNVLRGVRERARRGVAAADEGLFLAREAGWVVETPRRAIVWSRGGGLSCADPAVGPIESTGLAWLAGLGHSLVPRRAGLGELLEADSIFVVNAVRGVAAVAAVWDEADVRLPWSPRVEPRADPLARRLRACWAADLAATAAGA